tara:strand:+ start:610 stop:909 length:300 start_codon:yes stop_codon:yes gene_type:complete
MDEQAIISDLNNGIVDSCVDDTTQPIKTDIIHHIIGYAQEDNQARKTARAAYIESLGVSDIETKIVTIRTAFKVIADDESKVFPIRANAAHIMGKMRGE